MTVSAVISPAVNSSSLVVGVDRWSILTLAVVAVPRRGSSSRQGCERCKMQRTNDFSTDWADLKRDNCLQLVELIKNLLSLLSSAARALWTRALQVRVPWRAWKEFNNSQHNFGQSGLVYGTFAEVYCKSILKWTEQSDRSVTRDIRHKLMLTDCQGFPRCALVSFPDYWVGWERDLWPLWSSFRPPYTGG